MKNLVYLFLTLFTFTSCCGGNNSCDKKDVCASAVAVTDISSITFDNSTFYDENGNFMVEKAKDAVIALMQYYNYPVYSDTRQKLWVSDYGQGRFTELGLACIGIVNNEKGLYMLQDLYLLPGQMLPEHWHEKPANLPVKVEGWFVRHGKSYIVGIGEDNLSSYPNIVIPDFHCNGTVETKHVTEVPAGSYTDLAEAYSKHWQMAGPQGAIMSEVANIHSNQDVRHADKALNDNFLGK